MAYVETGKYSLRLVKECSKNELRAISFPEPDSETVVYVCVRCVGILVRAKISERKQLENRPSPRMVREYAPPYPVRSLHRRLAVILNNIEGRCWEFSDMRSFSRYGGRGIKNFLTLNDLRFLWERDSAGTMIRPSIDRKNADGHYAVGNCRFIEFGDNCKAADHRQTCRLCGVKTRGIKRGMCGNCRPVPPSPSCGRCGARLSEDDPKLVCGGCRFETRPCSWCGQPITRDIVAPRGKSTERNKQWFCSKREHGYWLAALRNAQRGINS